MPLDSLKAAKHLPAAAAPLIKKSTYEPCKAILDPVKSFIHPNLKTTIPAIYSAMKPVEFNPPLEPDPEVTIAKQLEDYQSLILMKKQFMLPRQTATAHAKTRAHDDKVQMLRLSSN